MSQNTRERGDPRSGLKKLDDVFPKTARALSLESSLREANYIAKDLIKTQVLIQKVLGGT